MISTKGRYALRVMIDLARQEQGTLVPLKDIAERQELSKKYLEIIVRELVEGKLVTGSSGRRGGYRLTRKPEEYTVAEILERMEGTLSPVACLADAEYVCSRKKECRTLPMWKDFYRVVREYFSGITLADLLQDSFPGHI